MVAKQSGQPVVIDAAGLAGVEITLNAAVSLNVAGVPLNQVLLAAVQSAGMEEAQIALDPWGVILVATPARLHQLNASRAADPE